MKFLLPLWVFLFVAGCEAVNGTTSDGAVDLTSSTPVGDLATPHHPHDLAQPPDFGCLAIDLGNADLSTAPRPVDTHPPWQPVVQADGGSVVSAMEAWTVVWAGDETLGTTVQQFLSALLKSSYWMGLSEYGVGAGDTKGLIVLPGPPPTDDSGIRAVIQSLIGSQLVVPNANTTLFFILPKGTIFQSLYAAYHSFYLLAYAVQPQGSTFDALTSLISHEAVEAATDPRVLGGWRAAIADPESEIGDLCSRVGADVSVSGPPVSDGGAPALYAAQRWFSRAASVAGNLDPCVPAPGSAYFGVALDPVPIVLQPPNSQTCGFGRELIRLLPFTFGSQTSIHWEAHLGGVPGTITPASGDAAPGSSIYVELSTPWGGPVTVWVVATDLVDPSHKTSWPQDFQR